MSAHTLDGQIIDAKSWDEIGIMDINFYDVTLKVAMGSFPVGTKFDSAYLCGENSILELYSVDGSIYKFELLLAVGKQIS